MLPIGLDHLRQAQEINAALSRAGIRFLRDAVAASLAKKAHAVLVAARYNPAAPSKWTIDISSGRFAPESGTKADQQSTWQSLTQGTSSHVDYLNDEIKI